VRLKELHQETDNREKEDTVTQELYSNPSAFINLAIHGHIYCLRALDDQASMSEAVTILTEVANAVRGSVSGDALTWHSRSEGDLYQKWDDVWVSYAAADFHDVPRFASFLSICYVDRSRLARLLNQPDNELADLRSALRLAELESSICAQAPFAIREGVNAVLCIHCAELLGASDVPNQEWWDVSHKAVGAAKRIRPVYGTHLLVDAMVRQAERLAGDGKLVECKTVLLEAVERFLAGWQDPTYGAKQIAAVWREMREIPSAWVDLHNKLREHAMFASLPRETVGKWTTLGRELGVQIVSRRPTFIQRRQMQTPQTMPQKRIPRNDPCPCRSGKKYKNCCMRKAQADSDFWM
jgi:hypothetical protein